MATLDPHQGGDVSARHRRPNVGGRGGQLDIAVGVREGAHGPDQVQGALKGGAQGDRKSTRLNSSHSQISYAVFCLKKKTKKEKQQLPVRQLTSRALRIVGHRLRRTYYLFATVQEERVPHITLDFLLTVHTVVVHKT